MKKRIVCFLYFLYALFLWSCQTQQSNTREQDASTSEETDSTAVSAVTNSVRENDSAITSTTETPENVLTTEQREFKPSPEKTLPQSPPTAAAPTLKEEAKKFCDFFKTYEEPSQFYTVPALQAKEVKGNAGTIISVNPDDLTTLANQPVEKPIEVELKELIKQEQLLKSNTQTVCKGRLLVSGGAYYVNMRSDGQQLKLKPGRSVSIKFPKLTDAPMSLFTGYRDSLGQMQWQARNQVFKPNGMQQAWRDTRNTIVQYDGDILEIDTMPKRRPKQESEKEKQRKNEYEKLYTAMDVQSLGWINCDRFSNIPDKTNLSIQVDPANKLTFASMYLIFEGINSIMQTHFGATPNGVSNPGFTDIPVGAKVKLIAFSLKNGKPFVYTSGFTIKKQESISVSLKETTDEELKSLLGAKYN